jgi:hypothetical protein
MGTQYAFGQIVTDGLVLCLNASDRNSYVSGSTTWNDVSGRGNNGTLTNGPTFNSLNGGSIVFDGTNDYVVVPESSSVDITTNTITFGGWCYPTISNLYQHIVVNTGGGDLNRQYGMWLSQFGTSKIYRNLNGVVSQDNVNISTPWQVNAWNYIMLVYNGSTIKIYLNGVQVHNENASGNITQTNSNVFIGGEPSQSYFFNGRIASSQIYNRALSAQEVLQNYNALKSRFGIT